VKHLKDERGSVLVLEIIIAAVVLVAVGYGVYLSSQAKSALTAKASPTATATPAPKPSPSPTASAQYLTFTQWGVRAPYEGNDKLTYVTGSSGSWGSLVDVVSGQLAAKYPGCVNFGAGEIKRMPATTTASQAMATDSNLTVEQYLTQRTDLTYKHVGDYFYLFMHDQAVCQNNNSVDEQNQANNAVQALVGKLEAVK